jgi:hypothetical protein
MFGMTGDTLQSLDVVTEDQPTRPGTRDSAKRFKESHEPAPLLPEIGAFGSGSIGGGEIGWDESMFKR